MNIGIYYGSTTGNAKSVAEALSEEFADDNVSCRNIADASPAEMQGYDLLILGSSTWGDGELQDDWVEFFPSLDKVDLSGKTVALFGTGDQSGWATTFVDAMGILYDKVKDLNANVIGQWPIDGYEHVESKAVVDMNFVGLAIDEENQSEKTGQRISDWATAVMEVMWQLKI